MIPTKSVAAFRQGQKTDANDALAIVLAAQQPEVKLAGIKSVDQQSLQCDTRVNEHLSDQLTATGNMLRGLVAEFGVTIPKGKNALKRALPLILEDAENGLPMGMRESVYLGWALWLELEQLLQRSDTLFAKRSAENEACQRLEKLEGVGPKNALRLYVALGNGEHFKNGREAAACVGVTPKQYSTGGKVVMRGIGKFKDDSVERLSERWHRFA